MEQQNIPEPARGDGNKEKLPDPIDCALEQLGQDMIEVGKRMDSDRAFREFMQKRAF